MMPLLDILHRFRDVKPVPNRNGTWKACCPVHKNGAEKNPSMSIWIGRDGTPKFGCWACRAGWRQILEAVGLTMKDLKDDRASDEEFARRKIVAEYVYCDRDGAKLYKVCRWAPKAFHQERWEAGKWVAGLGNSPRVLYRLPDLLKTPENFPVIICEGEKDVDALWKLGLAATCNVGGTGMGWRPDYGNHLHNRRIVVIPDNDGPGQAHAFHVAGSLMGLGYAASVRVVLLAHATWQQQRCVKDVSDYLAVGGTKDGLIEQIKAATEWLPKEARSIERA